MRKYRALLIFGIFICITSQSKSQTVFPLAIGNTWQYEINYYWVTPPIPTRTHAFSVVGDTLMSNGKLFYILEPRDMMWAKFIRSDSTSVFYWDDVYHMEKLLLDTTLPPDSEMSIDWFGFLTATFRTPEIADMFGVQTNLYTYELGGIIFGNIILSDKFGYIHYEYFADTEDIDNWELKGCIINDTLYGTMTDVKSIPEIPTEFTLHQNYPNPFNPITKIRFSIPNIGNDNIRSLLIVYDVLGNEIVTLVNEEKPPGTYEVEFDGSNLSSGVYFYRIQNGNYSESRKLVLLK